MKRSRLLTGFLLMLALSVLIAAQQAPDLYEQALVQEHAAGRLERAIALYTQAARAAGSDRELAARALIRAAGCDEKLGRPADAARLYADVMRAYPEQRAQVGIAQARLSDLRQRGPAAGGARSSVAEGNVPRPAAEMLDRYCVRCHSVSLKSGGLDLASMTGHPVVDSTESWERVVRRLLARRDPPPGLPRPDGATYRAVTKSLEQALDTAYAADRSVKVAERADDGELAARVAGLIWSGAPDGSLLEDARRGRLHEPAVLQRQVARMLRDPRSTGLVDGFFASWLLLDRVRKARPDPSLYPAVDADLVQAMDTETRLFLESQLRDDRDAADIWTANYTYVNAPLARHYGIPGVAGQEFRRVTWPDNRRAGLLGQAGILMALSNPSRTSPTSRGKFVLSRFLGVEAPNPPANVPALAEHRANPGTMRERMQEHRLNPACGSCHSLFDPLGFALENFDPTGAWRTKDGGAVIDASGTFVDGTRFDGPAGLRAELLKYREAYYTSVTQQLLAYALHRKGGQVYDYEMPAVRKIVRDAAPSGDRWSSLVAGIAASAPFQLKHPVP
ncbi:MAG TPA: DUF1592 domain-containing protein [Vicinamibacterales bacterium]|nr:DUF1592 domain-containing protein [Vicinamibacterales bacterium]